MMPLIAVRTVPSALPVAATSSQVRLRPRPLRRSYHRTARRSIVTVISNGLAILVQPKSNGYSSRLKNGGGDDMAAAGGRRQSGRWECDLCRRVRCSATCALSLGGRLPSVPRSASDHPCGPCRCVSQTRSARRPCLQRTDRCRRRYRGSMGRSSCPASPCPRA